MFVARGGRTARALALAGALALLALVLAQLLLPGLAADRISSKLDRYGHATAVSVSAWPALELLWGSVDTVTVHASRLALSPAQSAALLSEAKGTARIDATVANVREGPLLLRAAHLRKRGAELYGEGLMDAAAVRVALPPGLRVTLLASGGGRVRVRASGRFFGLLGSVEALARGRDGALVVEPVGTGLSGLRLTLFSDPRIYVEGVGAVVASARPLVYRLSMSARLR